MVQLTKAVRTGRMGTGAGAGALTILAVVVLALAGPATASAANITYYIGGYGAESDWLDAVPDCITEFFDYDGGWQRSMAGLGVTSDAGSVVDVASDPDPDFPGLWSDRVDKDAGEVATTTFSFAQPTRAFSAWFDLSPGDLGTGLAFEIALNGGGSLALGELPLEYGWQFFGIVSDVKFDSVTLSAGSGSGGGEAFQMDLLAVPEPATLALLGLGGAAIAFARPARRRLRRRS